MSEAMTPRKGPSGPRHPGEASAYTLGFTAASLRPDLARILAERYLLTGDWGKAREAVLSDNALQAKSRASAIRMERELRQRLMLLTPAQIRLAASAPAEDRAAVGWLAICKHVPFVFDFAAEVLRDKLAAHDRVLRPSDYEAYVESKAQAHAKLSGMSATSRNKIRQVLLRMLLEAGILADGEALGVLRNPVLSPAVLASILEDDSHWLRAFLLAEGEINRLRGAPS